MPAPGKELDMAIIMEMLDTRKEAIMDAVANQLRYVCQFKSGYKAMKKPSNIGAVVWDNQSPKMI